MIQDEELRNLYKISGEESVHKLRIGLLYLQQHPQDETTLEELLNEIHSLKGDSRIVGVEKVETIAHKFHEILGSIKHQQRVFTPELGNILDQGLEAIGLLVNEAVTGQASGIDAVSILKYLITGISEPIELEFSSTQEAEQQLDLTTQALVDDNYQFTIPSAIVQGAAPWAIAPVNDNALQAVASVIEDEELREVYQISSTERLQTLKAGLLYLQQHPNDEAYCERLRREAHSLKGDSRIVGVENVETLASQLEEVFKNFKCQQVVLTPELITSLSQGLEAISLLIGEAVSGQGSGVDKAEVLEQLRAVFAEATELKLEATQQQVNALGSAPSLIADEELREIYQSSSEERLQKLEAGLLHLQRYPEDKTILEELLREAHSLKGDSRSTGVESVEALTHQLEEILESIKRQQTVVTPQVSTLLYQGLDTIGLLVGEAVSGQESGVNTAQMLERLLAVVSEPTELKQQSAIPPASANQELLFPEVTQSDSIESIRVPTRALDALMKQVQELNVTRIDIVQTNAQLEELVSLWEEYKAFYSRGQYSFLDRKSHQERLETMLISLKGSAQENSTKLDIIAGELGEKIRTIRLLPLSRVFNFFPRMVHDLAREQSKEVELIIEGGETTADKNILEQIKDSVMHMLRNSIDHGIETPRERKLQGKPPTAKIWLRGYQRGNKIIIEVADNGRGLNTEKIKQTAIKRKLYLPEELNQMTTSQIHSLILASGFSTRTFITEISGRGIGLDVVRAHVERLQGNIEIESTPNQGCTFRIQLSTSLTTINVMLLEVQGIIQALPIEFVERTLLISPEQIVAIDGKNTIDFDGQIVPVINLADLLELSNSIAYVSSTKVEQKKSNLQPLILLKVGKELAGFFVNRLLDTQEVVLKPQSQLLKRVRNVTGATILGTGEVCTILNPPDLLKSLQRQTISAVSIKSTKTVQSKPVILLVEDSIPVRTQEKRLLEGAGYEVMLAVDGLDGYNKLKTRDFDAVISDVEMPNLDGFSLTTKIRQHQKYKELPIILVTTLNSEQAQKRGAEAGADAYVIKGRFNQDALLEILRKLI
ncbi:MAG: response regulator [Symploca sp. SIO2B6]|nr:response regulator [Symploca sp. SIO2B6]